MTAAFIYTAGILSGIPVGFILAAWALHRERVKVEPEDGIVGDASMLGRPIDG